ncbi:hypothetical protein [Burkholderia stagnalis]|uniref:DUF2622 domain-containing protein n=1 Tax=Burkholderia stagnalis TaxID=1503054 RepID=A0A108GDF0_9BURK|nr:hypothetical protein [Burkholderia stagnalis]KVZ03364.1 hypothetical protein WT35_28135 [Burkholderia stagnalis]KWA48371.1 hypothetical protein WT43_32445 [Burkholderia stagnalis]KWA51698.1 hypothetical protein WT42_16605 [Burkholderia stagnalis]KWA62679.1 hypothetical protein WT44_13705 [Burkholderia stagnalis]KWC98318.1 hypothetical protein WT46_23690 [Burkholderia stagnalis]
MPRFITRVELKDSENADYTALHNEMESRGFARTIVGRFKGPPQRDVVCDLPNAEYWFSADDAKIEAVRDLAKDAAIAIKKKARVLTVEIKTYCFVGLDEATEEAGTE